MLASLLFLQYMRQALVFCASRRSFNLLLFTRPGACAPSCSSEYKYIFAKSNNWKTIGLGASSINITSVISFFLFRGPNVSDSIVKSSETWCVVVCIHPGRAYHQLPTLTTAYGLEVLCLQFLCCNPYQVLLLYKDSYLL